MKRDDKRIPGSVHEATDVANQIRSTLERTTKEYTWLYHAAYDRTVAEEVKVRGGGNDPVGGLVSAKGKQRARSALADSLERLRDALAAARHAENTILRALDAQDPRERIEPTRYPRTATRDDLRLAEEAQERRIERGEHIP